MHTYRSLSYPQWAHYNVKFSIDHTTPSIRKTRTVVLSPQRNFHKRSRFCGIMFSSNRAIHVCVYHTPRRSCAYDIHVYFSSIDRDIILCERDTKGAAFSLKSAAAAARSFRSGAREACGIRNRCTYTLVYVYIYMYYILERKQRARGREVRRSCGNSRNAKIMFSIHDACVESSVGGGGIYGARPGRRAA